jgi:hypothetical protein
LGGGELGLGSREFERTRGWTLEDFGEVGRGMAFLAFRSGLRRVGNTGRLLALRDVSIATDKASLCSILPYPLLIKNIICESHNFAARVRRFNSPLARWFFSLDIG